MYKLEIDTLVHEIKSREAKRVLIQLPDGLKNKADEIVLEAEKETGADVFIWFGSCYGACDIPLGLQILNIDLIVQWGHNRFIKKEW